MMKHSWNNENLFSFFRLSFIQLASPLCNVDELLTIYICNERPFFNPAIHIRVKPIV